jgi:hypothetical protein
MMDDLTLALRQEAAGFRPADDALARVMRRGSRRVYGRRIGSAAVALGLFALVDLGLLRGLVHRGPAELPAGPPPVTQITHDAEGRHGAGHPRIVREGSVVIRLSPDGTDAVVLSEPVMSAPRLDGTGSASKGEGKHAASSAAGGPELGVGSGMGHGMGNGTGNGIKLPSRNPQAGDGEPHRGHHKGHHDRCVPFQVATVEGLPHRTCVPRPPFGPPKPDINRPPVAQVPGPIWSIAASVPGLPAVPVTESSSETAAVDGADGSSPTSDAAAGSDAASTDGSQPAPATDDTAASV